MRHALYRGLLLLSCSAMPVWAAPDWAEGTLTGDWGGKRSAMSAAGADLELGYKGDVLSVLRGGAQRGVRYLGHVDVKLSLAGEKLWGWSGSSAFVHVISNHGGRFNEGNANTAQGVDNIEVSTNTTKIFQAWLQQLWNNERWSVRLGLQDLNAEFQVTESSALFIHPTFGISSELGQTGVNGPSIFPTTSLGLRVKYAPHPTLYVQGIVLDGVPGDPDNPRGTHIKLGGGDGTLNVIELGWLPQAEGRQDIVAKLALGAWRYTRKFDDLIDTDANGNPVQHRDAGVYVLAERTLYREPGVGGQGLTGFIRFGTASAQINNFDRALGVGVIYKGLFPGRDKDTLGFAIAAEHNSKKHRRATAAAGGVEPVAESAYELTYRAQLRPWLAIQPELQFIKNHGEPSVRDTWLGGFRIEIAL